MDRTAYLEVLDRDGRRLVDLAEGRLDRAVPSCPDWQVADLVFHVGRLHRFWAAIAQDKVPDEVEEVARPDEAELTDWYRVGLHQLVGVLGTLAPDEPRWTWTEPRTAGFIQRRMAHETAVHAWDAADAAGVSEAIDTAVAVDGIEEFLDTFLRRADLDGDPQVIHLHATDAEGEWVVRVGDGALAVERNHEKGDAALRASASDLLLVLWGRRRPGDDGLEVFGDAASLDRFLARTPI